MANAPCMVVYGVQVGGTFEDWSTFGEIFLVASAVLAQRVLT